jgi:hypothetical protein
MSRTAGGSKSKINVGLPARATSLVRSAMRIIMGTAADNDVDVVTVDSATTARVATGHVNACGIYTLVAIASTLQLTTAATTAKSQLVITVVTSVHASPVMRVQIVSSMPKTDVATKEL